MQLTIATYHYVRNSQETAFPRINALAVDAFRGQLAYLIRHYTLVSADDVIASVVDPERPLPAQAALLTFDDGYRDHFEFVAPILREFGISGAFFPPAQCITDKCVLDVNKIHFILASTRNVKHLVQTLNDMIEAFRAPYDLPPIEDYWAEWAKPGRWDPAETIYVKRMLQKGLPLAVRTEITAELFRNIVTNDEADFADQLYMSTEQLTSLLDMGMHIGNHGYAHSWLNSLKPQDQEQDIDHALDFLGHLGVDLKNWMMCYPYGGYNDTLLHILRQRKCAVGLAITPGIANLKVDDPLTLPRIDTNDFPTQANALPCPWTAQISSQNKAISHE